MIIYAEKCELENQVTEFRSKLNTACTETEDMKLQLSKQEQQIYQLDKLHTENKQLQQKCSALETDQTGRRDDYILCFHFKCKHGIPWLS